MSICVYIKASPDHRYSIEQYIRGVIEPCEEDIKTLDLLSKYEDKAEIYGIYDTKKEAEERKKELEFEPVHCGFYWLLSDDENYSTITLDIFIIEKSGMYIVYKTIHYDNQLFEGEGYYEESFMIYLEDVWYDEYFRKNIRVNKPINITFQVEEDGYITEIVSHKSKKQLVIPFWTPTIEFHSLLGADRVLAPVRTVLSIDFRLQWQKDIELVTEDTRQIAHKISLPTLPTEIWMEILRILRIRDFGAPLF